MQLEKSARLVSVPTVSVSVLGRAGGGCLLAYCSSLGDFHTRLPFASAAEHVSGEVWGW